MGQYGEAGPPQDQPRGMAKWLKPDLMTPVWPLKQLSAIVPALRMELCPVEFESTVVVIDTSNIDSQFFNAERKI
ncbi:unnamed protein product [Parnassius apollo]|uniref:(apollo) hypothetical protein n=1 Tax=Parnassius apollo TaxID=110799 RepID=A0A8S3XZ03_PARAO|nr:unnamed protein product [Parnassius apollo]